MVLFLDLDLVVAGKSIHEGEGLMSGACIDDLVDERGGEVVFGTCPIKITEVCANVNGTLFFIHENMIRNPCCVCNGINEADCAQLLYLGFHCNHFGWMDGPLLLADGCHIKPCVKQKMKRLIIRLRTLSLKGVTLGGNSFGISQD